MPYFDLGRLHGGVTGPKERPTLPPRSEVQQCSIALDRACGIIVKDKNTDSAPYR